MKVINDSKIREIIENEMKRIEEIFPKIHDDEGGFSRTDLSFIDDVSDILIYRADESFEAAYKHFGKEINLSYLMVMATGLISVAIRDHDTSEFKSEFDKMALQSLMLQISNNALSIINLVENGLDNSARSIVRILNELTWITIAVLSEEDKMNAYLLMRNEVNEKKIWREHFSFSKLNKLIIDLERSIGFTEDMIDDFSESRKNVYSQYSQTIHSSYMATAIGSYGAQVDNSNNVTMGYGLFGGPSLQSNVTISTLNWSMYYLLLMFFKLIVSHYGIKFDIKDEKWRGAYNLYCSVRAVYNSNYMKDIDWSQYDFA